MPQPVDDEAGLLVQRAVDRRRGRFKPVLADGEAKVELIKSLAWVPFGLVLVAGVAFVIVVLLKVIFPKRRKPQVPDE